MHALEYIWDNYKLTGRAKDTLLRREMRRERLNRVIILEKIKKEIWQIFYISSLLVWLF